MALTPRLSQVLRFISAGGLGVLLYYSILYVLTDVAGVWYIASATIAFIVNCASNFGLQKFWTFKNKGIKNVTRQASQYLTMSIVFFAINLVLLYGLVEYARLWYLTAQALLTILLTTTSYFVSRRIFAN